MRINRFKTQVHSKNNDVKENLLRFMLSDLLFFMVYSEIDVQTGFVFGKIVELIETFSNFSDCKFWYEILNRMQKSLRIFLRNFKLKTQGSSELRIKTSSNQSEVLIIDWIRYWMKSRKRGNFQVKVKI